MRMEVKANGGTGGEGGTQQWMADIYKEALDKV